MRENEIYLISAPFLNLYKIGVSRNPKKRLKQLQTGMPHELLIVSVFKSKYAYRIESTLHRGMNSKKINEDFESLMGEWFYLSNADVLAFLENCKKIEASIIALKDAGNPFV